MCAAQTKYELLGNQIEPRANFIWLRVSILLAICAAASIAVYATWNSIYRHPISIPPKFADIPIWWYKRAQIYSEYFQNKTMYTKAHFEDSKREYEMKENFIPLPETDEKKLVCYYTIPDPANMATDLHPSKIDLHLCTHINVGIASIVNNTLTVDSHLHDLLLKMKDLKEQNKNLKILLWVGGEGSFGFSKMIEKHKTRKIFIKSLKSAFKAYRLDGVDLDWEFPSAYKRERQRFSQLLQEIRTEYQRGRKNYLLSVAVAAPEGIAFFAYNIREMNAYVDYVNVMSYDYHFYSKGAPFTGLNSPLYARHNEHSILGTLNINYTINYWHMHGMDKSKIIIGLPTYAHTFKLVNPFNNGIGSPTEGFGDVGTFGFASFAEVCWFKQNNYYVTTVYDTETCSPYLYAGLEWISYDDERSLECKTKYIKDNGYGGAMIFSLNTDDFDSHCQVSKYRENKRINKENHSFPLTRKVYSVLYGTN